MAGANIRPYVGAGLSYIFTEFDVDGIVDDDDATEAIYAHAGVAWAIAKRTYVALDFRHMGGTGNVQTSLLSLRFGFGY